MSITELGVVSLALMHRLNKTEPAMYYIFVCLAVSNITPNMLPAGYKTHTDCTENSSDKRDRVATVLVYLDTNTEGGETEFPG